MKKRFAYLFSEWLNKNPIYLKETRGRMRGNRAFLFITFFALLLSAIVGLAYLILSQSYSQGLAVNIRQTAGKTIFYTATIFQIFTFGMLAPGLTAGSISSEKEQQTFDLLLTTLLPVRSIVFGKLTSAASFLLLLFVIAIPVQSIAFMFGGVTFAEFIIGLLIQIVTIISFSMLGVFFSTITKRTTVSTILSYTISGAILLIVPALTLTSVGMFGDLIFSTNPGSSLTFQTTLLFLGWIVICTNPIASAIVTEIIALDNGSWFLYKFPIVNTQVTVLSPWIGFILLHGIITVVLFYFSVKLISNPKD